LVYYRSLVGALDDEKGEEEEEEEDEADYEREEKRVARTSKNAADTDSINSRIEEVCQELKLAKEMVSRLKQEHRELEKQRDTVEDVEIGDMVESCSQLMLTNDDNRSHLDASFST